MIVRMTSNSIPRKFGVQVRRMREERGWSQEALSFEAELDRTYVSGIERGVRNPTLTVIAKIAFGLGVTMSELMSDVEKNTVSKSCK
jgi:transcriptional regulator with XRE-family HTH domain